MIFEKITVWGVNIFFQPTLVMLLYLMCDKKPSGNYASSSDVLLNVLFG